jgi:hypothetical protein
MLVLVTRKVPLVLARSMVGMVLEQQVLGS